MSDPRPVERKVLDIRLEANGRRFCCRLPIIMAVCIFALFAWLTIEIIKFVALVLSFSFFAGGNQ